MIDGKMVRVELMQSAADLARVQMSKYAGLPGKQTAPDFDDRRGGGKGRRRRRRRRRRHRDSDSDSEWDEGPERPVYLHEGFKFHPSSGTWHDQASDFYFDVATQLYRHGATNQFYRFDINTQQYVQVDSRGVALTAAADAAPAKPKKKKKKKASDLAAGIAASVAATMGAVKALAAQNSGATADEKTGDDATATAATSSSSSSSGAARGALGRGRGGLMMRGRGGFGRGGFGRGATPSAVPLKAGKPVTNIKFSLKSAKVSQDVQRWQRKDTAGAPAAAASAPSVAPAASSDAKVPATGSSGGSEEELKANKHVDLKRMACLLCKRKFKNITQMGKHISVSELHKKNLQILTFKVLAKQQRQQLSGPPEKGKKGRAKQDADKSVVSQQRRMTNYESMKARAAPVIEEAKSKDPAPLDESNVGFRLLKGAGWKEGSGLGKKGQGITAPIEASVHSKSAGLGSEPTGANAIKPGDSYQEISRKRARHRFDIQHAPKPKPAVYNPKKKKRDKTAGNAYLAAMSEYNEVITDPDHVRPLMK